MSYTSGLGALRFGSDGVVLPPATPAEVQEYAKELAHMIARSALVGDQVSPPQIQWGGSLQAGVGQIAGSLQDRVNRSGWPQATVDAILQALLAALPAEAQAESQRAAGLAVTASPFLLPGEVTEAMVRAFVATYPPFHPAGAPGAELISWTIRPDGGVVVVHTYGTSETSFPREAGVAQPVSTPTGISPPSGPRVSYELPQLDYEVVQNPNGVPGLFDIVRVRSVVTYRDGRAPDPEVGPWRPSERHNVRLEDLRNGIGTDLGGAKARNITDVTVGVPQGNQPIPQPPPGSVVHIPVPGTGGTTTIKLPGSDVFVPIADVLPSDWRNVVPTISVDDFGSGGGVTIISNDPVTGELVDVTPQQAGMGPLGILLIGGAVFGLLFSQKKKGR